jgi:hypothetical protein
MSSTSGSLAIRWRCQGAAARGLLRLSVLSLICSLCLGGCSGGPPEAPPTAHSRAAKGQNSRQGAAPFRNLGKRAESAL